MLLEDWSYLQKYTNFKEIMHCHSNTIMFQSQKKKIVNRIQNKLKLLNTKIHTLQSGLQIILRINEVHAFFHSRELF